ncbi:MAG: MFS transporter, partial [Hyphomicrobiales bacterium]
GPYHAIAPKFNPAAIANAWTNKNVRYAYGGYLGHMWELYAMWAWIGVAATASYAASMSGSDARWYGTLTAFLAIAAGGFMCIYAGKLADKIGKADVAIIAMWVSGVSALATAFTFSGAPWLTFICIIVWGIAIIPDSAQFSALVADASPPEQAGSLMTFQTALGFALTFATVQITPALVEAFGWPTVLAGLALGPAFGIWSMRKLKQT